MSELTKHAQALLKEAEAETERVEAERAKLRDERNEKLAALREEYAGKEQALTSELKLAHRLRLALDPPKTGPKGPRKKPAAHDGWVPSEQAREKVLAALTKLGKVSINQVVEEVGSSHATVTKCLEYYRASGEVVLAGQRQQRGGPVKLWAVVTEEKQPALTPRQKVESYLREHGSVRSYVKLAEGANVPKGSISAAVRDLEREGLVEVTQDGPNDPKVITWKSEKSNGKAPDARQEDLARSAAA